MKHFIKSQLRLVKSLSTCIGNTINDLIQSFSNKPVISIVILNWNRDYLLRTTVHSALSTTKVNYELIIVDNNSSDSSRQWLKRFSETHPRANLILMNENKGGESINEGIRKAQGKYIFVCENDLEFLPQWDLRMLACFSQNPNLGQLSPFSPFPEENFGEIWSLKSFKSGSSDSDFYITEENLGTSCMLPREIALTLNWGSLKSEDQKILLPADGPISQQIRGKSLLTAWSKNYLLINWGHNKFTKRIDPEYTQRNTQIKIENNIDGLKATDSVDIISNHHSINEFAEMKMQIDNLQKTIQKLQNTTPYANLVEEAMKVKYLSFLFYDTGEGFSQKNTCVSSHLYNGEFELNFDLTGICSIQKLRWDPLEGSSIKLSGLQFLIVDENSKKIEIQTSKNNGFTNLAGEIVFETKDPWVEFETNCSKIQKIIIRGQLYILS